MRFERTKRKELFEYNTFLLRVETQFIESLYSEDPIIQSYTYQQLFDFYNKAYIMNANRFNERNKIMTVDPYHFENTYKPLENIGKEQSITELDGEYTTKHSY